MPLWARALTASRRVPRETPRRGHEFGFGRDPLLQRPFARMDQLPQLGGDLLHERRPVGRCECHDRVPSRSASADARWRPPFLGRGSVAPGNLGQGREEMPDGDLAQRHGQQQDQRQRPGAGGAVQQPHAEGAERRQQVAGGLRDRGQRGGFGGGAAAAADHHHHEREDAEPETEQHRGQRRPGDRQDQHGQDPGGHRDGGQVEGRPLHPGA